MAVAGGAMLVDADVDAEAANIGGICACDKDAASFSFTTSGMSSTSVDGDASRTVAGSETSAFSPPASGVGNGVVSPKLDKSMLLPLAEDSMRVATAALKTAVFRSSGQISRFSSGEACASYLRTISTTRSTGRRFNQAFLSPFSPASLLVEVLMAAAASSEVASQADQK